MVLGLMTSRVVPLSLKIPKTYDSMETNRRGPGLLPSSVPFAIASDMSNEMTEVWSPMDGSRYQVALAKE